MVHCVCQIQILGSKDRLLAEHSCRGPLNLDPLHKVPENLNLDLNFLPLAY